MTLNCKQTRQELALWVGNDHDPLLQPFVGEHLDHCPECRAFAREIRSGTDVLRDPCVVRGGSLWGGEQGNRAPESVWPQLRTRLSGQRAVRRASQYAPAKVGWFPVAGLTVACMALIAVSVSTLRSSMGDPGFDAPLAGAVAGQVGVSTVANSIPQFPQSVHVRHSTAPTISPRQLTPDEIRAMLKELEGGRRSTLEREASGYSPLFMNR